MPARRSVQGPDGGGGGSGGGGDGAGGVGDPVAVDDPGNCGADAAGTCGSVPSEHKAEVETVGHTPMAEDGTRSGTCSGEGTAGCVTGDNWRPEATVGRDEDSGAHGTGRADSLGNTEAPGAERTAPTGAGARFIGARSEASWR